jgi:hypothetical protein
VAEVGWRRGGSGWVGVVPLDRGDQGGENDTKLRVTVAVLTKIRA